MASAVLSFPAGIATRRESICSGRSVMTATTAGSSVACRQNVHRYEWSIPDTRSSRESEIEREAGEEGGKRKSSGSPLDRPAKRSRHSMEVRLRQWPPDVAEHIQGSPAENILNAYPPRWTVETTTSAGHGLYFEENIITEDPNGEVVTPTTLPHPISEQQLWRPPHLLSSDHSQMSYEPGASMDLNAHGMTFEGNFNGNINSNNTNNAFTFHLNSSDGRIDRHRIAEWISPISFENEYRAAANLFLPGTGQWFFEHAIFTDWRDGKADGTLLWCRGNPGTGKTVLSAQIIKRLNSHFEHNPNVAILYIYCNHQTHHDLAAFLESLLRQLIHQSVRSQHLLFVWEKRKRLDKEQVLSALRAEIGKYDSVFVIIDALDELDPGLQLQLLKELCGLSKLSLLITSRPNLVGLFNPECAKIEISASPSDLNLYVAHRVKISHSKTLKTFVEKSTLEVVGEKVVSKSDGIFLIARLQLDALEACITHKMVNDTLKSLPSSLNDLYAGALERIPVNCRKLTLHALSWVAFSRELLTVEDLRYALAATNSTDEMLNEDDLVAGDEIVRLCVGLVSLNNHTRYLLELSSDEKWRYMEHKVHVCSVVHVTVKEYLLQVRGGSLTPQANQFACHLLPPEVMVSACLKYLSFPGSIPDIATFKLSTLPVFSLVAARSLGGFLREVKDLSSIDCSFMFDLRLSTFLVASLDHRSLSRLARCTGSAHFILYAAYYGLANAVQYLLSIDPSLVNGITVSKLRDTPLVLADANDSSGAEEARLPADSVDRSNYDVSPLHIAAARGFIDVVKVLLGTKGIDVNLRDEDGRSPLHHAILNDNEAMVKLLLAAEGIDVNLQDNDGQSPLYRAVYWNGAMVELLLTAEGIDVNLCANIGWSPLYCAVMDKNEAMVKLLVDAKGIDVNLGDKSDGESPLHRAVEENNEVIVRLLLAADGINVNARRRWGKTPLHDAVSKNSLTIVRALLAVEGIDINVTDDDGETPLDSAIDEGYEDIVEALRAAQEKQDEDRKGDVKGEGENCDKATE